MKGKDLNFHFSSREARKLFSPSPWGRSGNYFLPSMAGLRDQAEVVGSSEWPGWAKRVQVPNKRVHVLSWDSWWSCIKESNLLSQGNWWLQPRLRSHCITIATTAAATHCSVATVTTKRRHHSSNWAAQCGL